MPTKDAKQNAKDQANLKQRRRESGLVRVEVWVKSENRDKLKEMAKDLSE